MTKDLAAQALRTALDPHGSWISAVLQAADTRLTEVRSHMPDAAGLVIATDQTSARAYADLLKAITGQKPTLVLSDDTGSGKKITSFAQGDQRWMVAVRMVSEGVDVPRLAVGVYATTTSTPLFFAQAVGRFVRARSRGETASVFVPSVPLLLSFAAEMERERDHVLAARSEPDEAALLAAAELTETEADLPEGTFAALGSEADFDRVVFDGADFGLTAQAGSAEEQDYLGLPGLLEPDQVKDLLRRRQADHASRAPRPEHAERSTHQVLRDLRKELNGLVGAWHHRTDTPHGVIHAELRTACGGPPSAVASADELQQRIDEIRHWAITRKKGA
jgi:superfamily II DNA or RNA helicase